MEELIKTELKSLLVELKENDYGNTYWVSVVKAILILFKYKDKISYDKMVKVIDELRIELSSLDRNRIYEDFSDEILSILINYSSGDINFKEATLEDYRKSSTFKKYFDQLEKPTK